MEIARPPGSTAAACLITLALAAGTALGQVSSAPPRTQDSATPVPIGTTTVKLPEPRAKSATSVEEALRGRRAPRTFGTAPVTLQEVGQLLWAAQGITGKYGGRAAPSAGALFPLEVILVAANVTGLPPAVYRYRPTTNDLVRVAEGDPRPAIADACHFQPLTGVPAIFVITTVESRTAKAYGDRAPKYVALEAGAASQNFALEAVALGLGCGMLVESETAKFARAIGTGPDETPFTVLVVTRPEPTPRP
ncbi:MAG: SagB/ThcOx family dehydrogenase [Thermoanaerobaculaceae bacterium]|nr:SagB/ThcOx family dehydrogenase [Thermoanaerobaculaceae bacterium]TAM44295.1 MAG: SagB/ThcOx family dehydrogenase [Acidobacteriota bacterium]